MGPWCFKTGGSLAEWGVASGLLMATFVGNPTAEPHTKAIAAELARTHPISSNFIPNAVIQQACKRNNFFLFSTTSNGSKTCSFGALWYVYVFDGN